MASLRQIDEAAESSGVDPETVRVWIERGYLRSVSVGGVRFVDADDLNAVISVRHSKPQEEPK